eukprot:834641-Amphidinium_carterae.1
MVKQQITNRFVWMVGQYGSLTRRDRGQFVGPTGELPQTTLSNSWAVSPALFQQPPPKAQAGLRLSG